MQHIPAAIPNLDTLPPSHALTTAEAAAALNRAPQTLRRWACEESGPLRPVKVNGRLAWRVSDLRRLLDGGDQ
ncbi:MAG: helix-turn-helix domain-containing protein [Betaproteobacteria bacterium]|nr:helix-turn-helix domain-containing protein [Betaproteobacteria bacterium]